MTKPYIDLTNLKNDCDELDIIKLCRLAINNVDKVRAVCVWPKFVNIAKDILMNDSNTRISVATVINFPFGNHSVKEIDKDFTLAEKADEIDAVYRDYLLEHFREKTGSRILKVIIESGIHDYNEILRRTYNSIYDAQADFIKTSTGKVEMGACLSHAAVIMQGIVDSDSLREVGIKISGGIKTYQQIADYNHLADIFLHGHENMVIFGMSDLPGVFNPSSKDSY